MVVPRIASPRKRILISAVYPILHKCYTRVTKCNTPRKRIASEESRSDML
jgi:hypothetical protein